MLVGDLVKYVGRDGTAYYGVVIEVDPRRYGAIQAQLQCADYPMWFQRRTLEVISESR
jgi:hypothetical protein